MGLAILFHVAIAVIVCTLLKASEAGGSNRTSGVLGIERQNRTRVYIRVDTPTGEDIFYPKPIRSPDSRTCCRTEPYNVTTQQTYISRTYLQTTVTRQRIVRRRLACPGLFWSAVDSCNVYALQTLLAYHLVTHMKLRRVITERYCRDDDFECCQQFTLFRGGCITDNEKEFYEMIGLSDDSEL